MNQQIQDQLIVITLIFKGSNLVVFGATFGMTDSYLICGFKYRHVNWNIQILSWAV